jgi:hypothetical protein
VFPTGITAAASPLYGLTVVELTETTPEHSPILIDPVLLGVTYYSTGTLLVDPFTGIKKNETNVRLELSALAHLREPNALYTVGKEATK